MVRYHALCGAFFVTAALIPICTLAQDFQAAVKNLQAVQAEGVGHQAAQKAYQTLINAPLDSVGVVLDGIHDDKPLAANWLRAAAASIVDRAKAKDATQPLLAFVNDSKKLPAARFAAFELLTQRNKEAAEKLIPNLMNDPSLDLRRLAVAEAIAAAEQLTESDKKKAGQQFTEILTAARDVDQIESIAKQLEDLKVDVDLVKHFGFLTTWHLIGPFDHTGSTHFDTTYDPERVYPPDFKATYEGQLGKTSWKAHTSEDRFGLVDLNTAMDKHKGAIAYACTKFRSDQDKEVEFRMGCINANKVWLNGELLTSNEVYHSNTVIDQYVGHGKVRKGDNWVLIKIAQNEQDESWAQRWQFQLRVCDSLGTAFLESK